MKKVCTKCNIEKELSGFHKNNERKSGYVSRCKDCRNALIKIYRDKNKEKMKSNNESYRIRRKLCENTSRVFLSKEEKRSRRNKYSREYIKKRCESDELFKIKLKIRKNLNFHFLKNGFAKKSKTFEILGIGCEEFKLYIESMFLEGMTWENHGEWHLDHKIPISWAKSEEELYILNHYTNFQPLWADDNLSKGNRFKH